MRRSMRTKIVALMAAILLAPLSVVYANQGYQGPINITKVKDLSSFGFIDQDAIIQGRLVKRIDIERFEFKDETGSVTVEMDDDIHLPNVNEKTVVRLYGEYEGGFEQEFEADYVEIISQS